MVIPVGPEHGAQILMRVELDAMGQQRRTDLMGVRYGEPTCSRDAPAQAYLPLTRALAYCYFSYCFSFHFRTTVHSSFLGSRTPWTQVPLIPQS